jgi:two-component system CitB family sensor kinase
MPGKRRIDVRLATQILLLQLAVVALTLGITFALLAVVFHQRLIEEYGNRCLDIARVVAAAPAVLYIC